MPFRAWSRWQAAVIRASVRSATAASACDGATACARLQGRRIQVAVHRIGTGALAYEVAELGAAQVVLDLRVVDVIRHVGPACAHGAVVVGQRRNRDQRGKGAGGRGGGGGRRGARRGGGGGPAGGGRGRGRQGR